MTFDHQDNVGTDTEVSVDRDVIYEKKNYLQVICIDFLFYLYRRSTSVFDTAFFNNLYVLIL